MIRRRTEIKDEMKGSKGLTVERMGEKDSRRGNEERGKYLWGTGGRDKGRGNKEDGGNVAGLSVGNDASLVTGMPRYRWSAPVSGWH